MDSETEFSLVEAPPPVQPVYNRRVANLLDEEKGRFHQKTKRKRCDTWHGDENKQESQLDPDIEQGLNTKRKFARKNAWGYCSYADLITMALQRAPSKQMTLAEIYDWIVANIPFFKDKGDANSSVGWKNSIRHNLSLHDKFSRVTPTNATKNIGAYWTLVPENEQKDGTVTNNSVDSTPPPPPVSNNEQMASPRSPPNNIRKRSSTMPSSLNRPQRPSKYKRNAPDGRSISGDSGIDNSLSRQGSCASLATTNTVADEIARINLENSPSQQQQQQQTERAFDEHMQTINRHNREAKINPDNSVLVEIKLTGEQFELVKSGKFVVSLCPTDSIGDLGDPRLQLTNWNPKKNQLQRPRQQQERKPQRQQERQPPRRPMPPTYDSLQEHEMMRIEKPSNSDPQYIPIQRKNNQYSHPFSPLSSESSGLGQSYDSPPDYQATNQVQSVLLTENNLAQLELKLEEQAPMLNNNEAEVIEDDFKMEQTQRTNNDSTRSGMELSIDSNAEGMFDELYNDLNLYEFNDIYDMALNG